MTLLLGGIAFAIIVPWWSAHEVPRVGSPLDIREAGGALLRQVSQPPYEAIHVDGAGGVRHFPYPISPETMPYPSRMTAQEVTAYGQFKAGWCAHRPTFRALRPGEPFYELGVRCGYATEQATIPMDQLPSIFVTLRNRIPIATR
jgi:hypothetical protein